MNPFFLQQVKKTLSLSLPMAGSRFIQMLTGFIGMVMLAHLGRQVLAASALINSTMATCILIFISFVFAVSFTVGQLYGAKDYPAIGALVQQSLLLSLILSLCMMVVFWFADDIVKLFHQDPALVKYVRQYFHAMLWAAIPLMLQSCLQQFLYGILKQRLVIFVNLITLALGIPIAYVLIFGYFGFPGLGVSGLAYTFAFQCWLGFFIILGCCYWMPSLQKFKLFAWHSVERWAHFRQVLAVGWPMSLQFGGELMAFFVITMMVGWLGTNALAAVQVTQQWLFLVVVPIFAMSEAAGIFVGHAVGAKKYDQLNSIANANLLVALGLVLVVDVAFVSAPTFFASFYMNTHLAANAAILHLIRILFVILTLTLVLNSLRDMASGLLRGLYDTQFPMRVGLLIMWCLVLPLGYLMAFHFKMGVIGFKVGGNIGLFVGAWIVYRRWKNKVQACQALEGIIT